jgi:sugar phosphate isomerase/epimerase
MRLGAPVFGHFATPDEWANAARQAGYSAVYCPVDYRADEQTVRTYAEAARQADLVIAEVGAWSNPLSPDAHARREAIEYCQK